MKEPTAKTTNAAATLTIQIFRPSGLAATFLPDKRETIASDAEGFSSSTSAEIALDRLTLGDKLISFSRNCGDKLMLAAFFAQYASQDRDVLAQVTFFDYRIGPYLSHQLVFFYDGARYGLRDKEAGQKLWA